MKTTFAETFKKNVKNEIEDYSIALWHRKDKATLFFSSENGKIPQFLWERYRNETCIACEIEPLYRCVTFILA